MNKTDILETVSFERMIKQKNELEGFGKEVGVKIVDISEVFKKFSLFSDQKGIPFSKNSWEYILQFLFALRKRIQKSL